MDGTQERPAWMTDQAVIEEIGQREVLMALRCRVGRYDFRLQRATARRIIELDAELATRDLGGC
jgi:hypothetical protein